MNIPTWVQPKNMSEMMHEGGPKWWVVGGVPPGGFLMVPTKEEEEEEEAAMMSPFITSAKISRKLRTVLSKPTRLIVFPDSAGISRQTSWMLLRLWDLNLASSSSCNNACRHLSRCGAVVTKVTSMSYSATKVLENSRNGRIWPCAGNGKTTTWGTDLLDNNNGL